jgi:hypothetical protein
VRIEIEPFVEVVCRGVKLSARATRLIESDTTTTLLHHTDTADLRDSCTKDVHMLAHWIEAQARDAALAPRSVLTADQTRSGHRFDAAASASCTREFWWALKDSNLRPTD